MTSDGSRTSRTFAMAPVSASKSKSFSPTVGLEWLIRLRWVSIVVQVTLLSLTKIALKADYESLPIVGIVAALVISNMILEVARRRGLASTPRTLGAAIMFDTAALTGTLLLSGGPMNPFSVFYLVQVALAALLLETGWVWAVALATSCGFASLFVLTPEPAMHAMHHGAGFQLHLQGMWASYALAAAFVGYFVSKVARALARREEELRRLQEVAARSERLASLSTLAAGAAHELGTPIGTIAIIATELERATERGLDAVAVREDARLLRAESDRCRTILTKMAAQAGENVGELSRSVSIADLVSDLRESLGADAERVQITMNGPTQVSVPRAALGSVLTNLVRNALDADETPSVRVERVESSLVWEVSDNGAGIAPEILARLGEPFFTTKPVGKGLGLGLFLVNAFADRIGGSFKLSSQPGEGTRATLVVPLESP